MPIISIIRIQVSVSAAKTVSALCFPRSFAIGFVRTTNGINTTDNPNSTAGAAIRQGVVALDLAGAEALFKTADFAEEFAAARKDGVPFTIHAGEADGPDSVRSALEFGAVRIGHGVRIAEDAELVKYVAEHNIPLEMCPNSNRQTKAVSDMNAWPLRKLLEAGVKVTINTDDPAICRTNLAGEFKYIEKMYGITAEEKKLLLQNAAEAAFCSEEYKKVLKEKIWR